MVWNRKKELVDFINSFKNLLPQDTLETIAEYVECNEPQLAIKILSDWIYDLDVLVNKHQESELCKLSKHYDIDEKYHKFIGEIPPYPDLRTESQKWIDNKVLEPNMENVQSLVKQGLIIEAIKMYRELNGISFEEASRKVNNL